MKGVLIPADPLQAIREVEIPNGLDARTAAIHDLIEGYLEIVPFLSYPSWVVYVNEDAKAMHLDINIRATQLSRLWPHDHITGNAVILGFGTGGDEADCPNTAAEITREIELIQQLQNR